jgi:outer membrane protein assembly factor BamB
LIIVAGGKRQLIVWTGESVTALNPATGETYWREAMVTSSNDSIPTSNLGSRKFAWTPPAYANRHVFARNDEELIRASLAAGP